MMYILEDDINKTLILIFIYFPISLYYILHCMIFMMDTDELFNYDDIDIEEL